MTIDESTWKFYQEMLGYTDEELETFKQNPSNEDVVSKAAALMDRTIVFEVVASHGCAGRHRAGDRFHFDGSGNLITKLGPGRICISALTAMAPLISAANELCYAGVDSNDMRFKRTACHDVGLQCGGWGNVAFEMKVEKREK
ncbi:MAG: TIGR04076 family protein [Deltaproteobacteria bacterium]|nr:TIGR04076 family protein [Deltaproteobacteria bacterium]